jgi:hypothetical protein
MPPPASDILHSPCFPQPWDDPEDHVDLFVWLGAIDSGDMPLLAQYLRHSSACDKRVLGALADKLDPPIKTASRYVWKRNRGRPLSRLEGLEDPVEIALAEGDLSFVADHLKTSANPDQRIICWLAEQMDPDHGRSHFEFKQARGRKMRGRRAGLPFINDTQQMFLGAKIARLYRQYGKLESALAEVVGTGKPCESRSAARRAYDHYLKNQPNKKPAGLLD